MGAVLRSNVRVDMIFHFHRVASGEFLLVDMARAQFASWTLAGSM